MKVPADQGGAAALWFPTDLGMAVLALAHDPASPPLPTGLTRSALLADLRRLPALLALYDLVAGLAAAGPGIPQIQAWTQPWRGTWEERRRGRAVSQRLPAGVTIAWQDGNACDEGERDPEDAAGTAPTASYVLLPDLGVLPPRARRAGIRRFLAYHAASRPHRQSGGGQEPPVLVIAADAGRVPAWEVLLDATVTPQGWTGWRATGALVVVDWAALRAGLVVAPALVVRCDEHDTVAPPTPGSAGLAAPSAHLASAATIGHGANEPVPRRLGGPFAADLPALALTPDDWALLDLTARHPFLPCHSAARALGWNEADVRRRRRRLYDLSLARPVGRRDLGRTWADKAALDLAEATLAGLRAVAGRHDLALGAAVARLGLAGGGPEAPVGQRAILVRNLAHTLGVDELFVAFHVGAAAAQRAGGPDDEALVAWENAAACAQGPVQPDGYGIYRRAGQRVGFFLEFDRGLAGLPALTRKFHAYGRWHDRGRWRDDYEGFPTILVVTEAPVVIRDMEQSFAAWRTAQAAAEVTGIERVALAVRRAEDVRATARAAPLPVLVTTNSLIRTDRTGVMGAIWSAPTTVRNRRHWFSWDHEDTFPM